MSLRLAALISAVLFCGAISSDRCAGAESIPLFSARGELPRLRDKLAPIFQFEIEDGPLKIDRAALEAAAATIDDEDAAIAAAMAGKIPLNLAYHPAAARRFLAEQRKLEGPQAVPLAETSPPSPLFVLFGRIEHEASKRIGFSGSRKPEYVQHNDWKEWSAAFTSNTIAGELRANDDGNEMLLWEREGPQRRLEFRTDGSSAFFIRLIDRTGAQILIRQDREGRFYFEALFDGKKFVAQDESFVAFVRKHREPQLARVWAGFSAMGICPILPLTDPELRDHVLALLDRSVEDVANGKKLLGQLESDDEDIRNRASLLLDARYPRLDDLIHEKIQAKPTPREVRQRLESIAKDRKEPCLLGATVAACDLLNDAPYLLSLLDDAEPKDYLRVVRQLEAITGMKPGNDAKAWKEWLASQPVASVPGDGSVEHRKWSESSLAAEGELQGLREVFAELFRFDGDFDVARLSSSEAQSRFLRIQGWVRFGSKGFSANGGGDGDASFTGDTLRGRRRDQFDSEDLIFIEMHSPKRTLELHFGRAGQFQIRLSSADEFVALEREFGGTFSVIAVVDGQLFVEQEKSFVEFCRRHRALMELDVLPLYAKFGIRVPVPRNDDQVEARQASTDVK
jgi:hypothetical protein